jgi:hypothetical protein
MIRGGRWFRLYRFSNFADSPCWPMLRAHRRCLDTHSASGPRFFVCVVLDSVTASSAIGKPGQPDPDGRASPWFSGRRRLATQLPKKHERWDSVDRLATMCECLAKHGPPTRHNPPYSFKDVRRAAKVPESRAGTQIQRSPPVDEDCLRRVPSHPPLVNAPGPHAPQTCPFVTAVCPAASFQRREFDRDNSTETLWQPGDPGDSIRS